MKSRECKQERIPPKCTNRSSLEQDFVQERCFHAGQFVFAFLNKNRIFRKEMQIFNQLMNDFCTKILRTYCLFSEDYVNSAVETEPANSKAALVYFERLLNRIFKWEGHGPSLSLPLSLFLKIIIINTKNGTG